MGLPVSFNFNIDGEAIKQTADLLRDGTSGLKELIDTTVNRYTPGLRVWAARNLYRWVDILDEENKKREKAGLRSIPVRFALPALAQIAQEDTEELLVLWARLIANLQDGERSEVPERLLISLLSEMGPVDAALLKLMADRERDDEHRPFVVIRMEEALALLDMKRDRLLLALLNLTRLACLSTFPIDRSLGLEKSPYRRIDLSGDPSSGFGMGLAIIQSETVAFRLTALGIHLIDACRSVDEKTTASVYGPLKMDDAPTPGVL